MSCGEMTDRDRRVWHHMYETCETPAEHAERIVRLEELCKAALNCIERNICEECRLLCGGCTLRMAMRDLGIEVG